MLDKVALKRSTFLVDNIIKNGRFELGREWWSSGYQSEIEIRDGVAVTIDTSINSRSIITNPYLNNEVANGDIVYIATTVKTDIVGFVDRFRVINGVLNSDGFTLINLSNEFERKSFTTIWGEGDRIRFYLTNKSDAEEKPLLFVKDVLAINLTKTFGKGHEPTAKQIDSLLSQFDNSWFDGSTNVFNAEHMLKMYFNKTKELDNAITSLGGSI